MPPELRDASREMYRHYLAMTLALDDMLGELLEYLDRTGKAENTLVVFTSDHGSQVGAQGVRPWEKRSPYEALERRMEGLMRDLQAKRGDELAPCTQWSYWLDSQRRVVCNAYGPLSDPEGEPDWSLLS